MLPVFFVEQIGFGFEETNFSQRQFDFPTVAGFLHRHIAPGCAGVNGATRVGGDNFAAARGSAAEIGAQQGAPGGERTGAAHGETNAVADEAQEAFAGRRFHDGCRLRHFNSGVVRRTALRFRRRRRKATLLCRKKRMKMAQRLLFIPRAGESNDMTTLTQTQGEEAQLLQTIEMFEVIVQSQPNDCQSLEILKEAYSKLGREQDVINTSKRIAQAYMQQGQLSSAILEYETVLQRRPDDADVQAALKQIEDRASNVTVEAAGAEPVALAASVGRDETAQKGALARGGGNQ